MTTIKITRYSDTRELGAAYPVGTKLTKYEHDRLHEIAEKQGISAYAVIRDLIRDLVYESGTFGSATSAAKPKSGTADQAEPQAHDSRHESGNYSE